MTLQEIESNIYRVSIIRLRRTTRCAMYSAKRLDPCA